MTDFNANTLLLEHGPQNEHGRSVLLAHSEAVMQSSHAIAQRLPHLQIDMAFLGQAAMIHDIGIAQTHAPSIGCFGVEPYLAHGILGAELMRKLGYPHHALVCERHIGVGLTRDDISAQELPLPLKDYVPETIEERIVCYVDNFYSKGEESLTIPKPFDMVRKKMASFGQRSLEIFDRWALEFGPVER